MRRNSAAAIRRLRVPTSAASRLDRDLRTGCWVANVGRPSLAYEVAFQSKSSLVDEPLYALSPVVGEGGVPELGNVTANLYVCFSPASQVPSCWSGIAS